MACNCPFFVWCTWLFSNILTGTFWLISLAQYACDNNKDLYIVAVSTVACFFFLWKSLGLYFYQSRSQRLNTPLLKLIPWITGMTL
ncbi:JM169 [macacine gammaherpesvirus 11]|uniref:JM169 n=2 Tax=macacine gammaherpesvirus 11 TaxID=2560570 RepID=G9JMZ6_9GAMA|nr:JM169 [Macaca fuscata rhadinovirus]AAT00146.1 JM169 [Macaca fuscata rhadinovirus]AEW87693.1 JM169 [Macaca fuscata rhadinovirus]AEW87863.1 JM169 [Macaca fuscata rhadinovirus]